MSAHTPIRALRSPILQTLRDVGETYSAQLIRIAGALVFNIWLTRWLMPSDRGYYGVALAVAMMAAQLGQLGLGTANIYFAAREPLLQKTLLGNSILAVFGVGPLLIISTVIIYFALPSFIATPGKCLALALVQIPFAVAYMYFQGLLLGTHRIRKYNFLELVNRYVPLAILGILLLERVVTPVTVLAAVIVGQAVSCIWALGSLYRHSGGIGFSMPLMRDMLHYGFRIQLAAVFSFLLFRVDLLMVAHMRSSAEAGYYSLATSLADYMSLPAFVAGTVLLPQLSSLKESSDKFHMMLQWLWGMAAVTIPLFIAGAYCGYPVIRWVCGPRYLPSLPGFLWLLPGIYFLGLACIAVQFISSIGYRLSVPVAWFLALVLNLSGNLYVIPRYGFVGASVMSSICYALAFALIFFIAWWHRRSEDVSYRSERSTIDQEGGITYLKQA